MKKLMILSIILIVGCGTEPEDCAGVAGGSVVEDECGVCGGDGSTCVVDIDGNIYEIVLIGEQLWMAENLKVTHYQDGTLIITGYSDEEWTTLSAGAYAVYDNDSTNVDIYGNLYNWFAVDDDRGICPESWHVPSYDEYTVLTDYLIVNNTGITAGNVGSALAGNRDLWNAEHDENLENNSEFGLSGFSALPGSGRSNGSGNYELKGIFAFFWTSSEGNSGDPNCGDLYADCAWYLTLSGFYSNLFRNDTTKEAGFSIRCVAD